MSLNELMELFEATMERQNRLMRMMASAWGAELEEPAKPDEGNSLYGADEVAMLPIALGYETVD